MSTGKRRETGRAARGGGDIPGARARSRHGPGMRTTGPPLEEALAAAVARAFAALRVGAAPATALPLELRFTVVPGKAWRIEATPSVEEQIRRSVREASARRDAFRPGRVWCYRCESADCVHSLPPAPECVFGGYGATGQPAWPALPELLLQRRHPGVGVLFGPGSRAIAADFVSGAELTGSQLEAFGRGSKTYAVLAQVVFGYLALRPAADPSAAPVRTAFTLQAVETRTARGASRVELNVIAGTPDGAPATEALADPAHLRVLNVVSVARRRLRHLTAAPANRPAAAGACVPDLAGRAEVVLRDAVRALGRLARQAERRTRHAEGRGLERRPTAKAREDALAAPHEALLRDGRRGTIVVLGPGQRVHVFSTEGRHVTSLAMDADAVRRRRRLERWEPLDASARKAFRAALGSGAGEEPYSPSPRSNSA